MKKSYILLILSFIIISSITISNYIHVSGNTFTMPSDNKENNPYHTYNIDNNNKNIHNSKSYNKNYNNSSNSSPPVNSNNPVTSSYNNSNNPKTSNYNNNSSKYTPVTNNAENTKNHKKNNTNKYYKNKQPQTSLPVNTIAPGQKNQLEKAKRNTITKIEFKKHFIKIQAGASENILFTTTPGKASGLNFIYKSNDNSIATFKDKKLTGIKEGFTTIFIMLPNSTVQAACPVKVI